MAFNSPSIHDTARILKIGINTVIRSIKTHSKTSNFRKVVQDDLALICELDEQSAVANQNKYH